MDLKRGLFRTAIVAAILLFEVGVVHRLLTEVLAPLIGEPSGLQSIGGIFVACGIVIAFVVALAAMSTGIGGVFRWVVRGYRRP